MLLLFEKGHFSCLLKINYGKDAYYFTTFGSFFLAFLETGCTISSSCTFSVAIATVSAILGTSDAVTSVSFLFNDFLTGFSFR